MYAWVLLAVGFFVLTAWDPTYLDSSEDYVSILAIIGGPALLIVTKSLKLGIKKKVPNFKTMKPKPAHERDMDAIRVRHAADMERNPHAIGSPAVEDSHGSIHTQVSTLREEVVKLQQQIKKNRKSD